ncbi:MAG: DNA primase [Chitinophagaceae bacterium]|nr:DNA primase [Chitinophagaceae bacterium]MBP6047482.1 DNA primase [Ferruginibacter sp.]NMD28878.1 DNA primase [Bacteroidota bacterium]MBK7087858.1 DNA primase [Chitinophagaceae bacterium]MBK8928397.1 DNA primase [Chitinophagaceae bacterium]
MISQNTIQQILSRIDIVEIVGSFVKLKKRGANYLGLCPFHNEKTPSFTVSPAKEIYKCFGCGKSGNSIGFLMEHEKYSYAEALRWLANKYNVTIEEKEINPEQQQQQLASDSLYIINGFAQKFFSDALIDTDEGKDIGLSYLKHRGFREDTIKKFQLGYNPDAKDKFAIAALAAQFNPELLQKSGLIVLRDNKPADNYRGRIIFPVHNQSGKVLGFGARLIKGNDKAPKYINSPENEIYVKSKILYGSYFARQAIDKADECLLVEGYTDVVSLHQAGIENVVASGGTSLTPDQLRLIKKYTRNLTIIYDGDNAGIKAALRGLNLALEEGLNVKLVLIPDGEDPDSYVNKTGTENFKKFVHENKKDFVLFQLEISLKDAANDPAKRSFAVNQVAETLSKINRAEDFIRRQDYIRQVAQILQVEEAGLHALVNKLVREKISKESGKAYFQQDLPENNPLAPETQSSELESFFSTDELNEQALIRSLLEFGINDWQPGQTVAEYLFTEVEENELDKMMNNQQLVNIYETYKKWYEEGISPTAKNFLYHENRELNLAVINIMDYNTEISPNWKRIYEGRIPTREELYKEEVTSTLTYLKLRKIKKLIAENQREFELKQMGTFDDQVIYLQTHQHLKDLEMQLTKALGTVIFK